MQAARSQALRPFVIISSSYLLFTITDGAIRMIVLLHAYNQSFSAFEVAIMFTLYELAGVFTNLAAGVMGAKWGIKFTLIIGLSLQLLSYGLLFGWQDDWTKAQALVYVTGKRSILHFRATSLCVGSNVVEIPIVPSSKSHLRDDSQHSYTCFGCFVIIMMQWHRCLPGSPRILPS